LGFGPMRGLRSKAQRQWPEYPESGDYIPSKKGREGKEASYGKNGNAESVMPARAYMHAPPGEGRISRENKGRQRFDRGVGRVEETHFFYVDEAEIHQEKGGGNFEEKSTRENSVRSRDVRLKNQTQWQGTRNLPP